jgi:hypothetical protein
MFFYRSTFKASAGWRVVYFIVEDSNSVMAVVDILRQELYSHFWKLQEKQGMNLGKLTLEKKWPDKYPADIKIYCL